MALSRIGHGIIVRTPASAIPERSGRQAPSLDRLEEPAAPRDRAHPRFGETDLGESFLVMALLDGISLAR